MPFTFPVDSTSKAGAVRTTADGTNFYLPIRAVDADGSDGKLQVNNILQAVRDSFNNVDPTLWDYTTGSGDIVTTGGNTQGSSYVKISKSIDTEDTETVFTSKFIVSTPVRLGFGMSLSQRLMHQRFSIEMVGVDANGNPTNTIPVPVAVPLSSVSQTTTTLTVTTTTPHGFVPNDRVVIYGVSDSRANYGEVLVSTVIDTLNFTVTATPYTTIPSVTIGAVTNSGFVIKADTLQGADNSFAVVWEGQSANNAKLISRASATTTYNTSDISFGTNNTNATQANTQAFADAWNPAYMYDLRYRSDGVIVRTFPMDSTNPSGGIAKRTQVVPDITVGYKIRLKARNNKGMTRPIGTVQTIAKTASTTATVTVPNHGLTVGDQIMIYGVRDQTNFANLTAATAVASVVDANNFTIAFGASATATSHGGLVFRINGSYGAAPANMAVQSIVCTSNLMTVVGSTNWSGFSIGDSIDLRGLVDSASTTSYAQYEGYYKVANISTTNLVLYAPGVANFSLINCGGAVVKRTDLRLHFLRMLDYTRHTVELDGGTGNYSDYSEAIPVGVLNMPSLTIANGQGGHNATISGNPVRLGGRALTANYTAVTTGQTADLVTTLVGAVIQKPFSIPEGDWTFAITTPITATADTALKAAGAAGIRNYLTGIQIQNTGTVATEVVIKDGATVIWRGYAPATMTVVADMTFPTPLRTTAAAALNFACITTGANVYVNAQGYQAP
jgi:hypothetical protein